MPAWIANLDVDVFITLSTRHSACFHWFWSKHAFINISSPDDKDRIFHSKFCMTAF